MTHRIKKQEFLGAVTLVSFSADGSLLYVGVGPTVFLYDTASGELLAEHQVLTRGILHGCDVIGLPGSDRDYVGAFFGQKRVSCFQNVPQKPEEARGREELKSLGKPKVFCDWVFDVQLLTDDCISEGEAGPKKPTAAVGLAHNLVQIWNPTSNEILRSVQCAERCILYALAFHGRSQNTLVVASGTVFQQILLWDPMAEGRVGADRAVEPAQRLHAHDGVLFKLTWSVDARSLASVSDDRTVQLWSNNEQIAVEHLHLPRVLSREDLLSNEYSPVFRAWGHSARIWDVSFWESGVATASEDGLCKLWDLAGKCVATLQGHMGRNVWRTAVHPSLKLIATGGGDGAAKLWDIRCQLMSSSGVPGAENCESIMVPIAAASTKKKLSSQSVRNIVLNPLDKGNTAFVASEHGDISRLDLTSLTSEPFFTTPDFDGAPTQGRSGGLSTFTIDSSGRFLLLGDVTGRVFIVEVTTGALLCSWTTQANIRIMKVWWDHADALFTSSANGVLCEWKPTVTEASESMVSPAVTMQLVSTFKIPSRSSTASLLVVNRLGMTRNIIGGDGHGNVYIFHRSLVQTNHEDLSSAQSPSEVMKGVHGRELVATLLLSKEAENHCAGSNDFTLFSGGHDGYICSFVLSEDNRGALTATQVGRESIRGISTIKQIWWSPPTTVGGKNISDLMVFGFHAAQAVLHNFTAQYRIFNVDCGGWRRPHALLTLQSVNDVALPSHTLVFTPPATLKDQVEVKVHSTLLKQRIFETPAFSKCSLHDHHHGRMTTCVAFLGNEHIVTAAEDNSLMLHRRRSRADSCTSRSSRWTSVATGVAHTTTVRALTSFRREGDDNLEDHIVISGGGKQRLNVWLVRGESDLLRHVCGHERTEAAQDHRILGLATFRVPACSNAYRLVAACNSEGSIQLLLLDLIRAKLVEIGDCRSVSRKPILSCVGFQENSGDGILAGLAVGSTDGLVTLWDLSALLEEITKLLSSSNDDSHISDKLNRVVDDMQPSGSYLAHDMGANCITLVSCTQSHDRGNLDVALISGGDDQNLFLRQLRFPSCEMLGEARAINASGSAIKTVACVDAQTVFAAGYDQRVSKWHILRDEQCADGQLKWQGAAFSECADIADLAVRRGDGADDVVVVGQGLQILRFQRG